MKHQVTSESHVPVDRTEAAWAAEVQEYVDMSVDQHRRTPSPSRAMLRLALYYSARVKPPSERLGIGLEYTL